MRKLFFGVLILLPCILSAQNAVRSNNSFTLNLIGIDYSYEQRVVGGFSLIGRVGYNTQAGAFSHQDGRGEKSWEPMDMGFSLAMEPRLYYNTGRRTDRGKNTVFNSFDFVAIEIRVTSDPINSSRDAYYPFRVGAMWGIRRVYGGHWLIEGNAGLNMYEGHASDVAVSPSLNLRFGFVF